VLDALLEICDVHESEWPAEPLRRAQDPGVTLLR